jgi:hypothetical protein
LSDLSTIFSTFTLDPYRSVSAARFSGLRNTCFCEAEWQKR